MTRFEGRGLLYALPSLAVLVVAAALFASSSDRPVRAARLYGGPTGAPRQSFRLELVESVENFEAPVTSGKVRVLLRAPGGAEASWAGEVGSDGIAEVTLPELPSVKRYEAVVMQSDRELARGPVELDTQTWLSRATRRGGWVSDRTSPPLELRWAVARGALAVPFPAELLLEVRQGTARKHAEIEIEADGAELATRTLVSGDGPTLTRLTPSEHSVILRARLRESAGAKSRVALPVVPGALDARVEGDRLVVRSPVPRERAYFTLVTERYRVAGGSVALTAEERGGASGSALLPALPNEPVWAVVSSAPDLRSPARVGWPVAGAHELPARTLDVAEVLLLDGVPRAKQRERLRNRRVKLTAAGVCAVMLVLSIVLLLRQKRRAGAALVEHFEKRGLESSGLAAPGQGYAIVALVLMALGFLVLGLFALLVKR